MATTALDRPDFPLLAHLDELVAELHEHVPAALEKFDAKAVHAARVATRRLSAALDLMTPVLSKRHRKPLADGLRRLRKRLGPLRDADVMIDHLGDLAKDKRHGPAVAWLTSRLETDRNGLREASADEGSVKRELRRVETWPMVRQEIAEAQEAVDSLLAESLHLQADAFAEQADRLAEDILGAAGDRPGKAGGEGARSAAPKPPRQNPHDVRITGKALRYTLEMAAAEGQSPGAGVTKKFKKMQDLLGDWHDYVVLVDRTLDAVVAAEVAHHDAAAGERILDFAKSAVHHSTRELSAFAKLWAGQGATITAKIRAAFPLTRPMTSPPELLSVGKEESPGASDASAAAGTPGDGVGEPAEEAGVTESGTGPDLFDSAAPAGREVAGPAGTPAA